MSGEPSPAHFVYLDIGDALKVYAAIFDLSVLQAEDQLRSRDALEGALGRPAAYAHYQDADLTLQAAVLAHGIAETQPFIDGNKRLALAALLMFLELNGCTLAASDAELAAWIIRFSDGASPEDVADAMRPRLMGVP